MRISISTAAIVAAAWVLTAAPTACAQTIVNGSFENGLFFGPQFDTLLSGSTNITGWTVGGLGIDWIGPYWQAASGTKSIDLSGLSAGSISQDNIATTVGQQYRVTFDMAGNPEGGPVVKSLQVLATGGSAQNFTFDTAGKTRTNMGWTTYLYDFVATSSSTTLSFTSLNNTAYGPALDNVSIQVIPVPEPASILGVAAVAGLSVRTLRRRKAVA
jgi:choice-of-anchor C domain-containing protein